MNAAQILGHAMMGRRSYRYQVVDVFTQVPLEGNPLAVFLDSTDLDLATMQKIARELNVSETVFVGPTSRADCVARLRIFTPRKEMDFAGHPTVGTGFVLLRQGLVAAGSASFCVEENVGAIPLMADEKDGSMLWLRTPPIHPGPSIERGEAAHLINVAPGELAEAVPQVLSAGNPTLFIALKNQSAVDRASLDSGKWSAVKSRYHPDPMCVFVFCATDEGAYSRMFAPDYGIVEDPATGSSTGPLASYMMRYGMTSARDGARFISEQGTQMGRKSLLHVRLRGENGQDGIDIGGCVTPVINGEIQLQVSLD